MKNDNLSLKKDLKKGLTKRALSTVLAGTLLFSGASTTVDALEFDKPETTYEEFLGYDGVKIFINGRYVEFNDDLGYPTVIDGTTYIPVRAVSNAFNAYIHWSPYSQSAYINKHGEQLVLSVGKDVTYFKTDFEQPYNANEKKISAKPFISNGRTYVPLRVIFEAFHAKVDWIGETKTVIVTNDLSKNSKYIDFKDEKVMGIKDIDLNKNYKKIFYDGQVINKEYIKLLMNCDQYKVLEQKDGLYIFSYQYLIDLNYLYTAHKARKNNLNDSETEYELWSISEREMDFVGDVGFTDGFVGTLCSNSSNMDEWGNVYYLESYGNKEEFDQVNYIIDKKIKEIKQKTDDPVVMVTMVNDYLCDIMTYDRDGYLNGSITFSNTLYDSLVNQKKAVCKDYTFLFKYMMDKINVPCINVEGFDNFANDGHIWNMVYVNGEWKIVDVTFNDVEGFSFMRHRYLLLNEDDNDIIDKLYVSEKNKMNKNIIRLTLKFD